jgi:hypothetical protein
MTDIDVSGMSGLQYLHCYFNQLNNLDVSHNNLLIAVTCYNNQLTTLDISHDTALTYLDCSHNLIGSIDVSQNTELFDFKCSHNQISSLDFSHCPLLSNLSCNKNLLTNLFISENPDLGYLVCDSNQLSNLDVANCSQLLNLFCNNNNLVELNVSQNHILRSLSCNDNALTCLNVKNGNNNTWINFKAQNNPNLTCIEVDDPVWSAQYWTNIDSIASFSSVCSNSCVNGIAEKIIPNWRIYPNPVNDYLTFEFPYIKAGEFKIHLKDALGKIVLENNLIVEDNYSNTISISSLSTGIYFLEIRNNAKLFSGKIIKSN